jgi:hypothetical protein
MLTVLLSELTTVRLVCLNGSCGAVVELNLKRLAALDQRYHCPVCRTMIQDDEGKQEEKRPLNHFADMANGLRGLDDLKGKVRVEFIVRDGSKP